jgi:two-component system, sensor histidine kinase ChiS
MVGGRTDGKGPKRLGTGPPGRVSRLKPPFVLCVLFGILLAGRSLAQPMQLKFQHLTLDDGLPHSKINCILQDHRGFMWFGTNEGLNRWDGYQFRTFQHNPDDPGSISADLIRCMIEDRRHNLWIGTEEGGLNRFDRDFERFEHFSQDSSSPVRLSSSNINCLLEDPDGSLWIGTARGLDFLAVQNGKAVHYAPYPESGLERNQNVVSAVLLDGKKSIWTGTMGGGLCLFDAESRRFVARYPCRGGLSSGPSDNDIRCLLKDRKGKIWMGTGYQGLNEFDPIQKKFTRYDPDPGNSESTTIRAIWGDDRGHLWIGVRSGLYIFDETSRAFARVSNDPDDPFSLSYNSVLSIMKDAKGDIWLGTREGVNLLNMNTTPFYHFLAAHNNRRKLNHKAVYAILESRDGDLWFGTEEGGLNHLNRKTGIFTYDLHNPNNPASLKVNNIKALLEDRFGRIWIGTFNGGLSCLDRKTGTFTHYVHDPGNPSSLTNNNVMALLEDRAGNLWVGTYDNGLDGFDRARGGFIHALKGKNLQRPNIIQPIVEDHEGKLWIGLDRSEVGIYDRATGKLETLKLNSRINYQVRSILEDRDRNMRFGTLGGGVATWNRKQRSFVFLTKRDGLPSDVIYGILEDRHGSLWMSTTNGLVRHNPKTGRIKTFYKENGVQSNQFNYNAYLKNRGGILYFGGINGVTMFNPDSVRENTYVPPVVFTDFKVFNKPVAVGIENSPLRKSIIETREIVLSSKQSVFTFEFAALNFANSKQNQYAYRMDGFEKDWNYVNDRRYATYTNLKPDKYVFRVKAANNDGLWNEQGASITLTILPPFWQKWWFKVCAAVAVLFVIRHGINYQIQKRNVLRTKALANVAQLKLLRNQMNPHFLFNAHNSIRSMILIDKERAWQMVTELSEFLRYTLLNFNKIEATLEEEINAVNNYLHIEKIRYRDSLEVTFTVNEAAKKCLVPAFFLQPLIENAVKYGMQTSRMPLKINVAIQFRRKMLSIDVSNTGALGKPAPRATEGDEVHGTSIENIRKRLGILFKNRYSFHLFEKNGWVHVNMKIHYDKMSKEDWMRPEDEIGESRELPG